MDATKIPVDVNGGPTPVKKTGGVPKQPALPPVVVVPDAATTPALAKAQAALAAAATHPDLISISEKVKVSKQI